MCKKEKGNKSGQLETIQTKLKNRLGLQKAANLVYSYRYLRGKEDIGW
jgi:hypothetical protein